MKDKKSAPKIDPIMAKAAKEENCVAQISGYTTEVTETHVRISVSRSCRDYIDIPRDGIIDFVDGEKGERTNFYISENARLRLTQVSELEVSISEAKKARIQYLRQKDNGDNDPLDTTCNDACDDTLRSCPLANDLCITFWFWCNDRCAGVEPFGGGEFRAI